MSQRINEKPSQNQAPTSEQKKQPPPIVGVSPDDPIGVESEGTGKPPAPSQPPTP